MDKNNQKLIQKIKFYFVQKIFIDFINNTPEENNCEKTSNILDKPPVFVLEFDVIMTFDVSPERL